MTGLYSNSLTNRIHWIQAPSRTSYQMCYQGWYRFTNKNISLETWGWNTLCALMMFGRYNLLCSIHKYIMSLLSMLGLNKMHHLKTEGNKINYPKNNWMSNWSGISPPSGFKWFWVLNFPIPKLTMIHPFLGLKLNRELALVCIISLPKHWKLILNNEWNSRIFYLINCLPMFAIKNRVLSYHSINSLETKIKS